IWGPTLIATTASTLTAVALCLLLRRLPVFAPRPPRAAPAPEALADGSETLPEAPAALPAPAPPSRAAWLVIGLFAALMAIALARDLAGRGPEQAGVLQGVLGDWSLPLFIATLLLIGLAGRVPVYERAVEGGREGLEVAVRIVPFLVMILTALAMLRASGALELLVRAIDPVTGPLGFPAEALPMALLRPLSGSRAYGVMVEL